MRTFRTLAVALAACATLFTACQKDNDGQVSLDAHIADQPSSNSKLYINNQNFACWNDGDKVNINGSEYTVAASDATHAEISNVTKSNAYTAAYPAELTTACNSGSVTMTIDPYQTYEADANGVQKIKSPMVGYTTDHTLAFRNVASLVRINLANVTGEDLKIVSIGIKNTNEVSIAGTGSVSNVTSEAPTFSVPADGSSSVNLNFENGETWKYNSNGPDFYLAIAPFSTASTIEIAVWAIQSDGTLIKFKKSSTKQLTINRNTVAPVSLRTDTEGLHKTELGKGTATEPYLIEDEGDLNAMRVMTHKDTYSDKYYKLENNINVSSKEWQPLGQPIAFNGNFNGNSKTLTLKLSPKDDNGTGLFSQISGATIQNLTLAGSCTSNSHDNIGAICGKVVGGTNTISNCTNQIEINGRNHIGGLIGSCDEGTTTISECINTATINAGYANVFSVGGFVGSLQENSNTTVTKCTNQGSIKAKSTNHTGTAGGIIGLAKGILTMTDCGNTGNICPDLANDAAGLVGCCQRNSTKYPISITNCYSTGNIITSNCKNIGGLTNAANYGNPTITNCYFSGTFSSNSMSTNKSSIASINDAYSAVSATNCYSLNNYSDGIYVIPTQYFNNVGMMLDAQGYATTTSLVDALNEHRGNNSQWTGTPFPHLTW